MTACQISFAKLTAELRKQIQIVSVRLGQALEENTALKERIAMLEQELKQRTESQEGIENELVRAEELVSSLRDIYDP